jgi:hypothetical protein
LSELARCSIRHILLLVSTLLTGSLRSEYEYLGWAVMCAEISRLPALCDLSVMYRNLQELNEGSVDFHRERYAKSLSLIQAKKLLTFEEQPVVYDEAEAEARFREILSAKKR